MKLIIGEHEADILYTVGRIEPIEDAQRKIVEIVSEEPLPAEVLDALDEGFRTEEGGYGADYPAYKEVVRHSTWVAEVDPNAEVVVQKQAEIESLNTEKTAMRGAMVQVVSTLPDLEASRFVEYAQTLKGDGALIKAGTRIQWEGALKKAAVDLWDNAQSTPAVAPNLWEDVAYHNGYRIIPETITATLAFSKDEVGYWPADQQYYQAKADGTVWTPSAYAAAWTIYEVNEEEA